jgi:hypothetical protein
MHQNRGAGCDSHCECWQQQPTLADHSCDAGVLKLMMARLTSASQCLRTSCHRLYKFATIASTRLATSQLALHAIT